MSPGSGLLPILDLLAMALTTATIAVDPVYRAGWGVEHDVASLSLLCDLMLTSCTFMLQLPVSHTCIICIPLATVAF